MPPAVTVYCVGAFGSSIFRILMVIGTMIAGWTVSVSKKTDMVSLMLRIGGILTGGIVVLFGGMVVLTGIVVFTGVTGNWLNIPDPDLSITVVVTIAVPVFFPIVLKTPGLSFSSWLVVGNKPGRFILVRAGNTGVAGTVVLTAFIAFTCRSFKRIGASCV